MRALTASLALLLAVAVSAGCSADAQGPLLLSGRIDDEVISVGAPHLSEAREATATSVPKLVRLGIASRLDSVAVEVGDEVKTGDVVATLDASGLEAQLEMARAAHRVASAREGVLGARLEDLDSSRSTIAKNRRQVRDTIAQLTATRSGLVVQLASAKSQLSQLKAALERLRRLQQMAPGGVLPPGSPDPRVLAANIAKLEGGTRQLETGIAKIDSGLGRARAGLSQLERADAKAADARQALEGLRDVVSVAAGVSQVAAQLAESRLELAVLRSPADGVVVWAAHSREAVIAGAPVVTIRPEAPASVTVYVTPEQHAKVRIGDEAIVSIDSMPGEHFSATVTFIGVRAQYPPSWMTTSETHMTRAFPVRVTLDSSAVRLPAGVPADVALKSGSQ